ncbi:hypothetical protein BH160DRAFT_1179 [Burkholderia sp. H160]|nr:hypothetical protein BH160DRAFT_1179 [Burkholderia sp. H160]
MIAAAIAYIADNQKFVKFLHIPAPALKSDFDFAAYTGVPWAVQATLVALVYPIVLSFIALMLQRRAHSTAALRAYVLDSAVVPAGASSVGLLVFMGGEYFASPYAAVKDMAVLMAPLLVMNGTWLLINVLLTGFFLSRTIRFIQEEEQQHVFSRVAVDVALRAELTSAVKQHVFANAAQSEWDFPGFSRGNEREPQVVMYSLESAKAAVTCDLRASRTLKDVHLHLLCIVARRWSQRAAAMADAGKRKAPRLVFRPRIGEAYSGEVALCSVEDGPSLTFLEQALVRSAFWFRSSRQAALSLSTRKMLEEIGGEVETLAEGGRFNAAQERLRDMLRLHETLLLACAADAEGLTGNAATIGTSPYSWGDDTFELNWLYSYRDIGRVAVANLEEDPRLFRALAVVPASISAALPSRPAKLLIDAQLVGMNLMYQLANWWTHKAEATLVPGTPFSGTLPAPLGKVYENAVVSFIGSWGYITVDVPDSDEGNDVEVWQALQSRASVYARHIQNSALLFLNAVARRDDIGSTWFLENFLKWWGNRSYDLDCADVEYDYRVNDVTLRLAEKSWVEASEFLWDGGEPISIDFANKALNLALRKCWESFRLYMILLLIENAGATPSADNRELKHAAALISGSAQRPGGNVDAWQIESVDGVLNRLLSELFGVETDVARINGFAESLRWESEKPEVSGWIYSSSAAPADLESMTRAHAILLVALAERRRPSPDTSKALIERWWKDIDKLDSVASFLVNLRKEVLSPAFDAIGPVVTILQSHLNKDHSFRVGRLAVAKEAKNLAKVSRHERRITLRALPVATDAIARLTKGVELLVFDPSKLPGPVRALRYDAKLKAPKLSRSFVSEKRRYQAGFEKGADEGFVKFVANHVRGYLVFRAFNALLDRIDAQPVNRPDLRTDFQASSEAMLEFINAVAQKCASLRAGGLTPVVLVGRSAAGVYLRPHRWGTQPWQCPLPAEITVLSGNAAGGFAHVNGTPVYEFDTPNGDCYVLSDVLLHTLTAVGADAPSALSVDWNQLNEEQLQFTVCFAGEFV